MAYHNFCKDLLVVIYHQNPEETFFDQSVLASIIHNFRGSFLKKALRILQTSLWQSLKPASKFWDSIKLLLVYIKSRRCYSAIWFFEESEQSLNSSIFKSPARMILSHLPIEANWNFIKKFFFISVWRW